MVNSNRNSSYDRTMDLGTAVIFVFVLVLVQRSHAGQQCMSCSGVEDVSDCQHNVACNDNEVCFFHHYVTESGSEGYDFGCAAEQACHHSGPIVGRRSDGKHTRCTLCCNDTSICNLNLKCHNDVQTPSHPPRECSDLKLSNPTLTSGVYTIYPYSSSQLAVSVYCVFESNGLAWTVIQRRYNGSVDFYRNWQAYKEGFGSPYGEYWLGNDIIHELTSHANHDLRINMTDFDSVTKYAEYTLFHTGDEENNYRLTLSSYSGDAGDCLSGRTGMEFSTYDRDNDVYGSNCAVEYKGAWWYDFCHCGNLNGQYLSGHHDSYADGINWEKFRGYNYALKSVTMMIRKY